MLTGRNTVPRPLGPIRPRRPWATLVLFVACYGLGGGFATVMTGREFAFQGSSATTVLAQQAALLAAYLAGAYLLLLHVVFAAHRFRFDEAGFAVFTWRGWRRFAWAEVRRAELSSHRGHVELVLFVGRIRRFGVPLRGYVDAAGLFEQIRARLKVPIVATPAQLSLLADR